MTKAKDFLFTAGMVLAMAFTVSCSGDDGDVNSQSYGYCLFSENEMCLDGPFALNDCNSIGGKPSNSCPYGVVEPSSSGGGVPSSSSVETDNEPSSSSDAPSSSSVISSSSSVMPSSSSVAQSSSSVGGLCANFVKGTKRLHYEKKKEQFCDERDGKEYVYVVIGKQTWMAENLNYNASGSKCHGEDGEVIIGYDKDEDENITEILPDEKVEENCAKYGRLYDWSTAMKSCPTGWHLPTIYEYLTLDRFVGSDAGKKLKVNSGWDYYDYKGKFGNGTDDYGFSALPGGYGYSDGRFSSVGSGGYWWSSSEYDSEGAIFYIMVHINDGTHTNNHYKEENLFSVRCVKDEAE